MNFNAATLAQSLDALASIPPKNSTRPILSNVALEPAGAHIRIHANDLSGYMSCLCPGMGGELLTRTTVNAAKLRAIVKNLPKDATLELVLKDDTLTVRSGRSRFKLGTLPFDDFPLFEEVAAEVSCVTIYAPMLRDALKAVQHAQAHNDVRAYLNGTLFDFRGDALALVSTDGHRLARTVLAEVNTENPLQAIVSQDHVALLIGLLQADEDVTLEFGKNQFAISVGLIQFRCKLLDGQYPDYERVIPPAYEHCIEVCAKDLITALGRASLLSDKNPSGRLRFEGTTLTAENVDHNVYGQATDQMDLVSNTSAEPFSVGISMPYLADALKAINTPNAMIYFRDSESALKLHPAPMVEHPDTFVLMPRRL